MSWIIVMGTVVLFKLGNGKLFLQLIYIACIFFFIKNHLPHSYLKMEEREISSCKKKCHLPTKKKKKNVQNHNCNRHQSI